ncbi:MAG TPA: helix-turn-helix domain-containing protein, partial [Egibacteraceae bacterium]|nr:helix-turn-helix domain-containing protein [Egibacteraceae bacterium]
EAAARDLEGVQPGITLPLLLANRVVGTVGITGPPAIVRPFGEIVRVQPEIMLRETMLVRLALLRERALQELLADVASFDAASSSREALIARGEELGFRLDLPRAVVVVALESQPVDDGAEDHGQRGIRQQSAEMDLLRTARAVFTRSQDMVAAIGSGALGVLCDIAPGDDAGPSGRARDLSGLLAEEIKSRQGIPLRVGIGRLAGSLADLRQSYDDAWMAVRLGRLLGSGGHVHHVADHPVGALLLGASPRARRQHRDTVLGALPARTNWPDLRRTIVAWCECGYRLVDTAAALRVHRNTLVYRLQRLEKLTGASLRDPRHAVSLYLACLLEDLDPHPGD